MRTSAIALSFLFLSMAPTIACKHKPSAEEQQATDKAIATREAHETAQNAAVTARLDAIAKLASTVKGLAAQPTRSKHDFSLSAKGPNLGDKANYDVLFLEQLADPSVTPPVRVTREPAFEGCKNTLQKRDTIYDSCKYGTCMSTCEKLQYLVVLRTRTITVPVTGTSSYTPGSIDADAFVFDLTQDNKLVGGGHLVASSAGRGTVQGSSARNDITDAFGTAVDDAVRAL